jgi:hypothetical protein
MLRGFNEYCVDAGAYDGVVGSNSRARFLNGWRGVVIEPNPRAFLFTRAGPPLMRRILVVSMRL